MSTAVDTAFEELVAAGAEEPEALHLVCATCYPDPGIGVVALCGYVCLRPDLPDPAGQHKCAECLRWGPVPIWPCGH